MDKIEFAFKTAVEIIDIVTEGGENCIERLKNVSLETIRLSESGEFINIDLNSIERIVCDYFKLPFEKLKLKSRDRNIVKCRQISMWFYKKEDILVGRVIGETLGGKSQATVLHGVKTVNNLMDSDKKYKHHIEQLEKRIKLFYERNKSEKNGNTN